MARLLRLEYEGAIYHVTVRGKAYRPLRDSQKCRHFFQRQYFFIIACTINIILLHRISPDRQFMCVSKRVVEGASYRYIPLDSARGQVYLSENDVSPPV